MIRKQINMKNDLELRVRILASQENKSQSQLINEFIEDGVRSKQRQMTIGEALLGLAKIGEKYHIKAPPDLSENLDDYLYGDKT